MTVARLSPNSLSIILLDSNSISYCDFANFATISQSNNTQHITYNPQHITLNAKSIIAYRQIAYRSFFRFQIQSVITISQISQQFRRATTHTTYNIQHTTSFTCYRQIAYRLSPNRLSIILQDSNSVSYYVFANFARFSQSNIPTTSSSAGNHFTLSSSSGASQRASSCSNS